jgi:thiol-disulfide isomerase/thioredoxin
VEAIAPRLAQFKLRMAPPPTAAAAAGAGSLPAAAEPVTGGMTGTGPEVPDFTFVDFDGGKRMLSEFRGRYVLLDFWGSWCRPCRTEIPYMKEAYARFRPRGLEVIGMDYEEGASVADVRAYLQQQGVTWTFATPDSVRGIIVDGFQVRSFPTLVLLDPAGRMMAVPTPMLRGTQLAATLDRVLPRP